MHRPVPDSLAIGFVMLLMLALTTCGKDSPTGPQAPSRVTVTPASVSLTGIGQTVQLSASVVDRNGSAIAGAAVTWTSSSASVASVSPNGLVTARQTGSATITATSGGVSGQAAVTVEAPVATRIELSVADTLMTALGQTRRISARVIDQTEFPLTETSLAWSSSDTTVATVDSIGLVTATGQGEADIMASADASSGTLRITVRQRPHWLSLSAASITLTVGATHQITYTVLDANGHQIPDASIYYVVLGSRSVIQVDRVTGLITALEEGTVTVNAYAGGSTSTGIVVVTVVAEGTIVQPRVASASISPSSFTMAVQDTLRFVATATDEAGDVVADAVFTWSSSDESVADVDPGGLATALMKGLTTISASAGSASAHAKLTVTPSERTSLAVLFEATDGTNWSNASGWLSDAPLDEWFGVTADDQGRVTGLALNGNNLEGAIPPALGGLAWLQALDLGGNPLSGPIPLKLSRLDLKTLILDDTKTCVPETDEIISWLDGMQEARVMGYCGEQDREVLISFYNATSGPEWRFNEGWATDAPLNEWYGVTVDHDGRVIGFESGHGFQCNSITGSIPPVLGRLERLEFLDLGCNRLTGTIPPELGNLTNLRKLYLGNNDLGGPIPPELGKLTNLEDFHLYYNANLGGSIPPEFGNLTKLDTLILAGNNHTDPIPPELGNMVSLEELSLYQNNLTGQIPPALGDLTNLLKLSLSDNQLDGPIPSELGSLSSLVELFLNDNRLSGPIPTELGNLSNLEIMYLDNNQLGGVIPPVLGNLKKLIALDLSGNVLSDPMPVEIARLSNLLALDLSDNQLSGTLPPELGSMTSLKWMALEENKLSGPLPPELSNLTYLRSLELNDNQFTGPIPLEMSRLSDLNTLRVDGTQLCAPSDTEFQVWLQGIEDLGPVSPSPCANPDLDALVSLYNSTQGSNWNRQANWLSERPINEWQGIETDETRRVITLELVDNNLNGRIPDAIVVLSQLKRLSLDGNNLLGSIPPQLGQLGELQKLSLKGSHLLGQIPVELANLTKLERLDLSDNGLLNGPIPEELIRLDRLSALRLDGTQVCVPFEDRFKAWLEGIADKRFDYCTSGREFRPRAYLTQAVQNLDSTVPLIAGEEALLRVFVTTGGREIEVNIPSVRATFYLDGAMVHVADIPAIERSVPREIDEGMAKDSANALVPASVIEPGLEMVVEIDPDGTIDPALGIGNRLPENGRMPVEVREVPPLSLTMVPFLWYDQPDRTILRKTEGLTSEHELFWAVRDLLPIRDFELTVRDYVWTSVDPVFENIGEIARETRAVYALDGTEGYYMGVLRDVMGGIASADSRTSVVSLLDGNIAHELAHNLGLNHAPCSPVFRGDVPLGIRDVDPRYPYPDGSIGVWGYDHRGRTGGFSNDHFFEYGTVPGNLVDPKWYRDLMGYCPVFWISDYHFNKSLDYRLTEEAAGMVTMSETTRSLLVWGGISAGGELILEPAFVVDGGFSLPPGTGLYRITGLDADDRVLFATDFAMDVLERSEIRTFAFAFPMDLSWEGRLARITLDGPGGAVSIDGQGDRPMAMLRDSVTGRVRGFLRDLPVASDAISARRLAPEPGLEVVISRGVPESGDW